MVVFWSSLKKKRDENATFWGLLRFKRWIIKGIPMANRANKNSGLKKLIKDEKVLF